MLRIILAAACVHESDHLTLAGDEEVVPGGGIEMHLEEMKTRAALGLGVAMRLQLRADLHVSRVSLAMRVGADVEIHSLSRRPELNGVRGKIIATAYCVL